MLPKTMIDDDKFDRLGQIAKSLSEALRALGYEQSLTEITQEIPDARDRLLHVGKMTEDAANQVISIVESGAEHCGFHAKKGVELSTLLSNRVEGLSDQPFQKALIAQCAKYADETARFSEKQHKLLTDILLTQTFQDLSGQIIKRVVDIISKTESQLLALLLDVASEQKGIMSTRATELAGPQTPENALKQNEVDDLLASLGF